jgi:hypothetical protein
MKDRPLVLVIFLNIVDAILVRQDNVSEQIDAFCTTFHRYESLCKALHSTKRIMDESIFH